MQFSWSLLVGINLLQGGYQIVRRQQANHLAWSKLAAFASLGVAFFLMLSLGGGWYFSYKAERLEEQSVDLYRELFPGERRVVNPRKQMENHLRQKSLGGQGSFLALLADTAKQFQGESSAEVSVNQMRFNDQQGELRLELNSQSLEQLEKFKMRLTEGGLIVDINSASEQADGVIGRVAVRAL